MIVLDAVIAAATKWNRPGLYKDWYGNLWQVYRAQNKDKGEFDWHAEVVFPLIVDEEEP